MNITLAKALTARADSGKNRKGRLPLNESSGVYTIFGLHLPTAGAPVFHDYLSKELESVYGGKWDLEADPVKHAQLMIAHIDKKRAELGIDKARERVMMDMASRQALDA